MVFKPSDYATAKAITTNATRLCINRLRHMKTKVEFYSITYPHRRSSEYERKLVETVILEDVEPEKSPGDLRPEEIAFKTLSESQRAKCSSYRLYDDERGTMELYASGNDLAGLRPHYLK